MRKARIIRKTKETQVYIELNLDGKGVSKISTPIGFLNHMLELFCFFSMFDIKLKAQGDIEVDIHHLNEDIGIVLGQALRRCLRSKNITRFSSKIVPMDKSLVRVSLDISGRPLLDFEEGKAKRFFLKGVKGYDLNYTRQFLLSLVNNAQITLHIDILKADDAHHVLEAIFKGLGLCLGEATRIITKLRGRVSSTKGRL